MGTPAFGGGITTSYVDAYGNRFNHKGGSQLGRWGWHGKPTKWISGYGEEPKPPKKRLVEDGEFGTETVKAMQQILKLDYSYVIVDGVVSSQPVSLKKFNLNAIAGAWEFSQSAVGSPCIEALQTYLSKHGFTCRVDGKCGSETIKALQMFLNSKGHSLEVDGFMGAKTVTAFQQFLNGLFK